jgi:tetratricopeptide (TPR) repeat protein
LSRFYAHTGQPDRAIAEAEKAVDLDPNDADGYAFGGLALNQTKRYKEANPWFKKAIRRNPSPPIWYLSHFGVSYIGMGNYEEALTVFKKAISTAPTAGNHALYCHTLSMVGKHEEALGIMKKAIGRQESQDWQNMKLSHLAEYYRRTGRYEEAVDTGRRLLDSNPNNNHTLRAYITLTCALSAMGKAEDADAAAEKILRIILDFSMEALTIKDNYFGLSFYDWFLKDETDKNLLVKALREAGLK